MLNRTREDLLGEIKKFENNTIKYPNKYMKFEQLEQENIKEMSLIKYHCIDGKCPNYSTVEYKGVTYHACYDDWSGEFKVGWHVIYCETFDLCIENKIKNAIKKVYPE